MFKLIEIGKDRESEGFIRAQNQQGCVCADTRKASEEFQHHTRNKPEPSWHGYYTGRGDDNGPQFEIHKPDANA
jgi:hypothetical protein